MKALRVLLSLVKNNIVREMEYRKNFFLKIPIILLWILLQLMIVEVYFQFTDEIFGWTKYEIFVLIGLLRIVKGLFDIFPRYNLFELPGSISRGDIDYSLTRPVDPQLFISVRYLIISEITGFASGFFILAYALTRMNFNPDLSFFVILPIVIVLSFVSYYSLFLAIATLAFFSPRLSAMDDIHDFISQTMRYPSEIFSRQRLGIELLLIPLVIISTMPTKILLGKLPLIFLVVQFLLTTLVFLFSRFCWNYALRRYSSASS